MKQRMDLMYKCISNSRYTPYLLAKKIGASAILESASFAKGRERYSILMTEEAFKIKETDDGIFFVIDGKDSPLTLPVSKAKKVWMLLAARRLLIFWTPCSMLPSRTALLRDQYLSCLFLPADSAI